MRLEARWGLVNKNIVRRVLAVLVWVILLLQPITASVALAQDNVEYYNETARQINPATAPERADPVFILELLKESLTEYLSDRGGSSQLENLTSPQAGFPQDLLSGICSFAVALNKTYYYINETEQGIREVRRLVNNGMMDEALSLLGNVSVSLEKANMSLVETFEEWRSLRPLLYKYSNESINAFITEYSVLLKKLLERLEDLLKQLSALSLQCYMSLQKKILEKLGENMSLANTSIVVLEYTKTVEPGGKLVVKGVLKAGDQGLEGRVVRVMATSGYYVLSSNSTVTGAGGVFVLQATIVQVYPGVEGELVPKPGLYSAPVNVTLFFEPTGRDSSVYRGCLKTLPAVLEYVVPELRVEGASKSMPGLKCMFNVTYPREAGSFTLEILLAGHRFEKTLPAGGGTVEIKVPPGTQPGFYRVEFNVPAHGKWYRARAFHGIMIELEDYILDLKTPSIVIPPFQKMIIKGSVKLLNGTPVANAVIRMEGVAVRTDAEGCFSASLPLSILELSVAKSINVTVNTTRPWNPVKTFVVQVHVLNGLLATIALALLALLLVIGGRVQVLLGSFPGITLIAGRRIIVATSPSSLVRKETTKDRKGRGRREYVTTKRRIEAKSVLPPKLSIERTRRGRLKELYDRLLKALSKISPPRPSETLREYFGRLQPHIPPAAHGVLQELLLVLEKWLYSHWEPDEELTHYIESRVDTLERMIGESK